MRETCARVLAAALMTGAIAAVVWLSALGGMPSDSSAALAAPVWLPQRSVTIHVRPADPGPKRVQRAPVGQSVRHVVRPAVASRRFVTIHTSRAKPTVRRRLTATKPKPAVPAPAAPAAVPAATPAPAPPAEAERDGGDEHGNGHAYGHDKSRGRGHEKHEE